VLRMTTSPLAADLSGCWDTRWLDLLTGCQGLPEPADQRGDVAEQWRSGRGNVADHRETLTGRGGTHGTKPCGAGMPAGLDVPHGELDRAHGRQLPPLSPPQRVNKGRNLRQVPSERSVARERLNSHSPALRGHLRWRVCRSWSEYA
jgi:hypothetical protein